MTLGKKQIEVLMNICAGVTDDDLDCDGCFGHIAEFAERELANTPICEAMCKIRTHLENCFCCKAEFECLLDALRDAQDH